MRGRHPDRGSVLMLVPAGVLVLLMLGAMAVDSAVGFMAQRELSSLAAGVANDVAGAALSDPAFYQESGAIRIDPRAADQQAEAARVTSGIRGIKDLDVRAVVRGDQVCVTAVGTIDYVFAKAFPALPDSKTVRGQAVATAVRGDDAVKASPGDLC